MVPGVAVRVWGSVAPAGQGRCAPRHPDVCLGILRLLLTGMGTANESGTATVQTLAPANVPDGFAMAFQAGWVGPQALRAEASDILPLQATAPWAAAANGHPAAGAPPAGAPVPRAPSVPVSHT